MNELREICYIETKNPLVDSLTILINLFTNSFISMLHHDDYLKKKTEKLHKLLQLRHTCTVSL